jgi:hypothetical protein
MPLKREDLAKAQFIGREEGGKLVVQKEQLLPTSDFLAIVRT